ncbi:MAG TPA: hypothetical protein VFT59_01260 [Candidatus Saccharimonadales bacterium]|nr:hypothetical protein [Candidatus Saccharimonadales bacterium]
MKQRFIFTDMPVWLIVALVALMLPRTLLNELGVVAEATLAYYVLALTPFVIWLGVALLRKTKKPMMDFLILGLLFGILLAVIHQLFWAVGSAVSQHAPQFAIDFASQFDPAWRELITRSISVCISLIIGLGSGIIFGAIATISTLIRSRGARQNGNTRK